LSLGNYTCEEDALGCVTLAKAGAGLYQTFRFTVEKELAEGTLVEVLQAFGGCSFPVGLVYPHRRLLPSRVRAFVDFIMEQTESLKAARDAARPRKARRAVA